MGARADVESSNSTNIYVEVIYTIGYFHYFNAYYDDIIVLGSSRRPVFPVVPASIVIRVGNTNLLSGATETVTILYYY